MSTTNILPIVGVTMASVVQSHNKLEFTATDGRRWFTEHLQDCCESVDIEDVCGELDWLVGSPITQAEETSQDASDQGESCTWTFYRIGTAKGLVVIRWLGISNGYYSEAVSFCEVKS